MTLVKFESLNNVSYIRLNRPDRYNALNKDMLADFVCVLEEVEENEDKVLILTGEGEAFSAGGDMEMLKQFAEREVYDEVLTSIENIVMKLYKMPKIIISAIHGPAAGLGLSIGLAADYVLAQEEAKLGMLFLGVGLAPDGGGHFWLKERFGVQAAKQFIWNMEQVTGKEAKKMGLIDQDVQGDVMVAAENLAAKLNQSPLEAMLATKLTYHEERQSQLEYYLKKERENQWKLGQTRDHEEGVSAFLEKRKAEFIGR